MGSGSETTSLPTKRTGYWRPISVGQLPSKVKRKTWNKKASFYDALLQKVIRRGRRRREEEEEEEEEEKGKLRGSNGLCWVT